MKNSFEYLTVIKPVSWLRAAFYGMLIFLLYRSALTHLVGMWHSDDFTYCWTIPFIVLYMIWEKRTTLAETQSVPSWTGFVPLAIGIVCFWLGELGGEYTILFLSCWLVVVALCWLHMGWAKLRLISFPILFSLAMIVPPGAVYLPLSLRLKLISSQIGVKMLQLCGMSAYREGNVIDLGFTQLQVVDACNGLRYLIPLLMMGLLMAYYFRAPLWKRIFLVASTVPLSIITNSLRIASVGILYRFFGAVAAEGFFHDFSGWLIFVASLGLLLLEMWGLNKIPGTRKARSEERGTRSEEQNPRDEGRGTRSEEPRATSYEPRATSCVQFIVAVVVLLATIALARTVDFREKVPITRPLAGFPLTVGNWEGRRTSLEEVYINSLHLSDYLLAEYRDHLGKTITLYVAYNDSQRKGESTHSPATCLPGSGWVFRESGEALLPAAGGGAQMTVRRAFMEKNGERMLVYYWFPQRGRVLTDMAQLKFYAFWDALTRHRTDGALVRLTTPLGGSEEPAVAEERLRGFACRAVPLLDGFLPK